MALFTAETAKRAALKSHEPTSARYVRPVEPDNEPHEADEFRRLRLARVRAQLNALDKLIAEAMAEDDFDAAKLDRLASAAIRLNEQERQLSNRSLPPTVKAPAAKSRRSPSPEFSPSPVEIAPKPVVSRTKPGVSTDTPTQSPELPPL